MLSQGDVSAGKLQQDTESLCTMGGYQDRITPAPIGDIAMADRHHIQIPGASSLNGMIEDKNACISIEGHQRSQCLVSV